MRTVIIGDLHGVDLRTFWNHWVHLHPSMLINLGDYDLPETVYQFMKIKKVLTAHGVTVVEVMGNHDHAALNKMQIASGSLKKLFGYRADQKVDDAFWVRLEKLWNEFERSENLPAMNHLRSLPFRRKLNIGGMKTLVMHGALAGHNELNTGCPGDLWFRLEKQGLDTASCVTNFNQMRNLGVQIMIRGHDHASYYAHWSPAIHKVYAETGYRYNLFYNDGMATRKCPNCGRKVKITACVCIHCSADIRRFHLVMPGALAEGYIAIIDSGIPYPVLQYIRIPVRRFRFNQSMLCWSCGYPAANNQKRCHRCGRGLLFCLHCMEPNAVTAKVCTSCEGSLFKDH